MEITKMCLGMFATNTYLLREGDDVILIDPASKAEKLIGMLEGKRLLAVLLTHGHFDHIKAVDGLYEEYGIPVYISAKDEELCRDKTQNLSFGLPYSPTVTCPVVHLREGKMKIGPFDFEVIFTPGHTPGSVCFLFEDCLFSGDTLFKGSIGRTDLKGGNMNEMRSSLRILKELDPELTVCPGHDEITTMGEELENNPFL
ncbi:MAG: MBL fold metallo-hydrolase [Erysipelotrichaceae bacterium]|nr:MBL fold metallo-hydrolase [Erysipelotrichaceae bacterium]